MSAHAGMRLHPLGACMASLRLWVVGGVCGSAEWSAFAHAELAALGNKHFVNTHRPGKTSPMVYAAREGHWAAVMAMIKCNGNPERQGSDWADFFMAATSTFARHRAEAIHCLMNLPSLLPVSPYSAVCVVAGMS